MCTRRGYTLAEMTGVVAIIGLIASLVVVPVFSARNQAEEEGVMRNLKAMRAAVVRMYQDTGYAPVQLSDLISTTKPTNVYQCNRLTS
ncbi:MAG: prepilin-type N-terminal cleavage/methylation domain-containing protein, partial [Armatimonadota bacterium]